MQRNNYKCNCNGKYTNKKIKNKMAEKNDKIFRVDVLSTLRALEDGSTVIFKTAGAGAETTLNYLQVVKSRYQLPVIIKSIDNGLRAAVTKTKEA